MVSEPNIPSNHHLNPMVSSNPMNPFVGIIIYEKLSKANHAVWRAQVLTVVRGSRLTGHLTGVTPVPSMELVTKVNGKDSKVPNLVYDDWFATDQHVLGFLLSSLSREILSQITTKLMAAAAWTTLEAMLSSQMRGRTMNMRIALATTQRGNQSITEYVGKLHALADEMSATGRPLDDDELVPYILTGLDVDFNPFVSSLITKTEPISVVSCMHSL
jgi:hypothetical protein